MKFQQIVHRYNFFSEVHKVFFRRLPLLRDKKNILFIELGLKEPSGDHLTQIPPAGLSPPSILLNPGGYREQIEVILWSRELQGLQMESLPPVQACVGCSHAMPNSLRIAPSWSRCWCFVVHKLHRQQTLQDSNAALWATGGNSPELCRLWTKLNVKGWKPLFIMLRGYLWDREWSYFTPSQNIIIFETRLLFKITCPASFPRLHLPCRRIINSVSCPPSLALSSYKMD